MNELFCILLVVVVLFGKANDWRGAICLTLLSVSLIFACSKTGGYL